MSRKLRPGCAAEEGPLLRVESFHTVARSLCANGLEMFAVACFHRANHVNRGDVGAGKGAIVDHLFDARAGRRQFAR